MEKLFFQGTDETPEVLMDPENNKFEITGFSMPEDVHAFYDPILEWMGNYVKQPNPSSKFVFKLTFVNSASAKQFYVLFKKINELFEHEHDAKVEWYYTRDDEDIRELGEEFQSNINVQVDLIEYVGI